MVAFANPPSAHGFKIERLAPGVLLAKFEKDDMPEPRLAQAREALCTAIAAETEKKLSLILDLSELDSLSSSLVTMISQVKQEMNRRDFKRKVYFVPGDSRDFNAAAAISINHTMERVDSVDDALAAISSESFRGR